MYIWSPFHSPLLEFGEKIYPSSFQDTDGVPNAIKVAYRQAEKVKPHSPIAYAILARKVVDAIAVDHGFKERELSKAIPIMAARGEITPLLAEAATFIRKFGNAAAHKSDADIGGVHVEMIEIFLAALVEHLYTAPIALQMFKLMLDLENDEDPDTSIPW